MLVEIVLSASGFVTSVDTREFPQVRMRLDSLLALSDSWIGLQSPK